MVSDYFFVLIYIGGFGLSDLLIKKYKLSIENQLYYFIIILVVGIMGVLWGKNVEMIRTVNLSQSEWRKKNFNQSKWRK